MYISTWYEITFQLFCIKAFCQLFQSDDTYKTLSYSFNTRIFITPNLSFTLLTWHSFIIISKKSTVSLQRRMMVIVASSVSSQHLDCNTQKIHMSYNDRQDKMNYVPTENVGVNFEEAKSLKELGGTCCKVKNQIKFIFKKVHNLIQVEHVSRKFHSLHFKQKH